MQGQHQVKPHACLKSESVWFKTKLVSQFLTLSFLLTQPFFLSYLHATPTGGEVVGGTGTISQTELTTTINQSTQNLAIDWQSFDVNTNERVEFIQPDTSSIALNRIISNNGSTIQGQIDANGQVILVNPNGVFFSSTATVNVGGLIASSLDIAPTDFMNGNYIFNEVLGAEGAVINSGIINASLGGNSSTGGNVALLGKQVKNDGLISANLGSVVLAAGKQSILTFDNQGLIGVKVTKEVLQEELGVEEAVINNGEINAAGGRVLLTASTSQDVFSQVVNNGELDQVTSVVVHEDGSFTLGGGADVLNMGSIDVSLNNTTEANIENTARIVLLGENITSSGSIKADSLGGNAGEIELHAKDEMLLTENSVTSAQAFTSGQGGLIKVLGDKVGLFDMSQINASGENGGGVVLFGGDREGQNTSIRNANFIYLGDFTAINADATVNGDGGKIITFAKDTARIYGNLFARGGVNGGDGGFIETSGLKGFEITNAPDVTSSLGLAGEWLIDPYNITIVDGGSTQNIDPLGTTFTSNDYDATLDVGLIETALVDGVTVTITTSSDGNTVAEGDAASPIEPGNDGNIIFDAILDYNGSGNATLTLNAENDIIIVENRLIGDSSVSVNDSDKLNLNLFAKGDIDIQTGSVINTQGGNFTVDDNASYIPTSFTNSGSIVTSGVVNSSSGNITITTSGLLNTGVLSTFALDADKDLNGGSGVAGQSGGIIDLTAGGIITVDGILNSSGGNAENNNTEGPQDGGTAGAITLSSLDDINIKSNILADGGDGDGSNFVPGDPTANDALGGIAGAVEINVGSDLP